MGAVDARKTHCPRNHPYSGDNLIERDGRRFCRECVRGWNKALKRRNRGGLKGKPRGEAHALAKLTADDVRTIRRSPLSQRELAALYPVSRTEIRRVLAREVWRHVA